MTTATDTARTFTNTTAADAAEVAAFVNDAQKTGARVEVDGREAFAAWSRNVAQVWGNGSVSVEVRGRRKGACGTVWVKAGQTVTVTVTA